jgi:beta-glucanase (GH16 family)
MLKGLRNITKHWSVPLAVLGVFLLLSACEDETKTSFTVDFSYEFIDDNHVHITNKSEGDYYLLDWDFANGEKAATSDKTKTYEVYYPQAGEYDVILTVVDIESSRKSVTKTISITKTDLAVSFSFNIVASQPNFVNLVNTSIGDYDSFKWLYRNNIVEDETNIEGYFPFAGTFDVELQVTKGSDTFSQIQSITISKDDPDYVSKFTLSWSDEFEGTSINTNDWIFETGAHGWGNNELQSYTNGANAEISNGVLIITAKKVNESKVAGSYTSTRMITKGKKEFTYGKMEIRAKLPSGRGIWPAIWMLGANISSVNWPACGEIDIMEYVGYQPNTIHATAHTTAGSGSNGDGSSKTLTTAEEEFHIYGLIWTEKEMVFYTDTPENITHTYAPATKTDDNWPFDKPQFFIFNIAVGGNWGGAQGIDNLIFPQTMEIDYVRVYQYKY